MWVVMFRSPLPAPAFSRMASAAFRTSRVIASSPLTTTDEPTCVTGVPEGDALTTWTRCTLPPFWRAKCMATATAWLAVSEPSVPTTMVENMEEPFADFECTSLTAL